MAKKSKRSKKSILSKNAIFNANISKIEKCIIALSLLLTIFSVLYCVYTGNITYSNGTLTTTLCAKKLVLINVFATVAASISHTFNDNKPQNKGVVLTTALCGINMIGNKSVSGIRGIFASNSDAAGIINQCAHYSELLSSVLIIILIALVFCRKAK